MYKLNDIVVIKDDKNKLTKIIDIHKKLNSEIILYKTLSNDQWYKEDELDLCSNGYFGIADIRLIKGGIYRCCVWDDKQKGIDLRRYIENPLHLKEDYKKLHVQNKYASIVLNTDDIVSINIRCLKENEW